ncbi:PepSY domain-containing protein [Brevirhabdus sp.]|uniref:PepSY domain-containing protein n=1 Tax=Brevirhabdus sp. TaxID=2004514 RepID=UPI0040594FC9
MKRKMISTIGAATAVSLGLIGGSMAMASSEGAGNAAELQAFQSAKISLGDAIKAAETKTGAKAMDASFEGADGNGQMATYEVELLKSDGTPVFAMINPADGSVKVSAKANEDENSMGENGGDGEDESQDEANEVN